MNIFQYASDCRGCETCCELFCEVLARVSGPEISEAKSHQPWYEGGLPPFHLEYLIQWEQLFYVVSNGKGGKTHGILGFEGCEWDHIAKQEKTNISYLNTEALLVVNNVFRLFSDNYFVDISI